MHIEGTGRSDEMRGESKSVDPSHDPFQEGKGSGVPEAAAILRAHKFGLDIIARYPGDDGQVNINPGLVNVDPALLELSPPPTGESGEQFQISEIGDRAIRVQNDFLGFELIISEQGDLTLVEAGDRTPAEVWELAGRALEYIHSVVVDGYKHGGD